MCLLASRSSCFDVCMGLLHEMDTVVAIYSYSFGDRKKRMAMVIFYGQRVEDNCYG